MNRGLVVEVLYQNAISGTQNPTEFWWLWRNELSSATRASLAMWSDHQPKDHKWLAK